MASLMSRVLALVVLVCFVFVLASVCFPSVAKAAADSGASGDRSLAEKKGIEGLFKGKGIAADDPRLAKPWQKYLAIASVAVTVVVWKFL